MSALSSQQLPSPFLSHAADTLADTNSGLSGPQIVRAFTGYALEYNRAVPHPTYPFEAPNKRQALFDNLCAFDAAQQYRIIAELCEHPSSKPENAHQRAQLRQQLAQKFAVDFGQLTENAITSAYLAETRHWLQAHPASLKVFEQAEAKLHSRTLDRNLLDDLRLSLELLLKSVLQNQKSLENQLAEISVRLRSAGGSVEFVNMFGKLLDYYSKYQNTYVKHNDNVNAQEVEFIFEMTAAFMRHLLRAPKSP